MLVNVFIVTMTIWHPNITSHKKPKYLALADTLEEDIRAGTLAPGQQLPTHRELADLIGVTVGTVTRGYAEAEHRGLIRGEIGRGTFVAHDAKSGAGLTYSHEPGPDFIELGLAFPLYGQDPSLQSTLQKMAKRADLQSLLRYQPSGGSLRHREAGAAWLQRFGINANAHHVLVTAGAQHALTVLLSALCKPGERIVTEALTYPGIKSLANLFQLRIVPVPIDEEGIIPEALAAVAARDGVKALYAMPNLHNPTTATLSEERRKAIAAIAQKFGLWIIEDDIYGLTVENPPPPLYCHAPEHTFFVGSLSKIVAGGIRVAFVAAPATTVNDVSSAIMATTWMASPITAEIAAMWIEDGTADRVLEEKREEARQRNLIALDCLSGLDYRGKPCGYIVWLHLPEPWTGYEFEQAAFQRRIAVAPAEKFGVGHASLPHAARIALTGPPDRRTLERGLKTLAHILTGPPGPGNGIF